MNKEIKEIIKGEAEKKYNIPAFGSTEQWRKIEANSKRKEGYISGREEGIDDMFGFVEWVRTNAFSRNDGTWYVYIGNGVIKSLTTEQLYLEYKKKL